MKQGVLLCLAGLILPCLMSLSSPQESLAAGAHLNDCPIILAQSWSSETTGLYRIQAVLNAGGYNARTVSVGPVSSAWDRACEIYAQVKGGTVDYGKAHSQKYGHARYGRTYPGIYPQWGLENTNATKINKIHLVGFSFEGNTARMLVDLLEQGNTDEIAATTDGSLSPLFAGHHQWVFSCTGIASPLSGTSLLDRYLIYGNDSSTTLKIILLISEANYDTSSVFDIDLDQWRFYNRSGESLSRLLSRLASQNFMDERDFAYYDLTPNGIYDFNTRIKPRPFVYYFSREACATQKTSLLVLISHWAPISSMTSGLKTYATFMGAWIRPTGPFPVEAPWYPNDGVVNTISEKGPFVSDGNLDIIDTYYGQAFTGIWNDLGMANKVDHFQLISNTQYFNADPWFLNFAEILLGLPPL